MNRDIIYKEESYQLIGFAYKIFNELGFGFSEKVYADAYEQILIQNKIPYIRENHCSVLINNKSVARNYFDFKVYGKIIIELKIGDKEYKNVCNQLIKYLKVSNLKLGLVIRFMRDGVHPKRIVNLC